MPRKAAVVSKATSSKKRSTTRGAKHSSYKVMVNKALRALVPNDQPNTLVSERKIVDYVATTYKLPLKRVSRWVRLALAQGVTAKRLVRRKASYRFSSNANKRASRKKTSGSSSSAATSPKKAKKDKAEKKEKKQQKTEKKNKTEKKEKKVKAPRAKKSPAPSKRVKKSSSAANVAAAPVPAPPPPPAPVAGDGAPALLRANSSFQALARKGSIPKGPNTIGVVFNTTDLPEVRGAIKDEIGKLLENDKVSIGVIANRGWGGANGGYKLEALQFTKDAKGISAFVEQAFGEGADWKSYYQQVLNAANSDIKWDGVKNRNLILLGSEGVGTVSGNAVALEVSRLTNNGVNVYAFHHSQLNLLADLLENLH